MKSFGLSIIRTKQIIFITVEMIFVQIIQQQIKLFVERRLWLNVKFKFFGSKIAFELNSTIEKSTLFFINVLI
jgi:hypothetical protein